MQSLFSHRQAPVRSGTRTTSRASAVSVAHHRVAAGATARRGASAGKVFCSAVASAERTQGDGSGRSNGPGQDKPTGGGGDSGGRSEAPGWWKGLWKSVIEAGPARGTVAAGVGVLIWHASLATKGDIKELKDTMITKVDLNLALTQSEARVKDSLKHVVTWPYLAGSVAIYVFGRWGK